MRYHYIAYLPALAIILALAWLLTGCATPAEQNFWADAGAVAEGAAEVGAVALDVDVALHEPDPHDRDAHRHWCEQYHDHPHCR